MLEIENIDINKLIKTFSKSPTNIFGVQLPIVKFKANNRFGKLIEFDNAKTFI